MTHRGGIMLHAADIFFGISAWTVCKAGGRGPLFDKKPLEFVHINEFMYLCQTDICIYINKVYN